MKMKRNDVYTGDLLKAKEIVSLAVKKWPRLKGIVSLDIESSISHRDKIKVPVYYNQIISNPVKLYSFDDLKIRGIRGRLYILAQKRKIAKEQNQTVIREMYMIHRCTVKWIYYWGKQRIEKEAKDCSIEFFPGSVKIRIYNRNFPKPMLKNFPSKGIKIYNMNGNQIEKFSVHMSSVASFGPKIELRGIPISN